MTKSKLQNVIVGEAIVALCCFVLAALTVYSLFPRLKVDTTALLIVVVLGIFSFIALGLFYVYQVFLRVNEVERAELINNALFISYYLRGGAAIDKGSKARKARVRLLEFGNPMVIVPATLYFTLKKVLVVRDENPAAKDVHQFLNANDKRDAHLS